MTNPAMICVDWGSSNCRAFLMNEAGEVIDSMRSEKGMLTLSSAEFEKTLVDLIKPFLKRRPLQIILGGMVGSRQGWVETPYVECPVSIELLANNLTQVPNLSGLNIVIAPGVNAPSTFGQWDVMRGEEVQLFGALSLMLSNGDTNQQDSLFCLPGTHSKWVQVAVNNEGQQTIIDFATNMTGEIYNLLIHHSILGRGVDTKISQQTFDIEAFEMARLCIENGGGLMHQLFSVRSNVLAGLLSENQIESYLSGLLINTEVNAMLDRVSEASTIYIIGNDHLNECYQHVLKTRGRSVISINGEQAASRGLFAIAQKAGLTT